MSSRVKICGITDLSDALAAIDAGADALGFMFYEKSPRWIDFEKAATIIRELPPFVAKVGVFVNAPEDVVRKSIEKCGLDTLQFHGEESPEFCRRYPGVKVIKAFRIQGEESLGSLPDFRQEAWLLDSYVPGQLGGTGARFNWALAAKAVRMNGRVILAGGLTPENIALAVVEVRPYGLDVSSGVESSPGRKDHKKMRKFIAAAKQVPAAGVVGSLDGQ